MLVLWRPAPGILSHRQTISELLTGQLPDMRSYSLDGAVTQPKASESMQSPEVLAILRMQKTQKSNSRHLSLRVYPGSIPDPAYLDSSWVVFQTY